LIDIYGNDSIHKRASSMFLCWAEMSVCAQIGLFQV